MPDPIPMSAVEIATLAITGGVIGGSVDFFSRFRSSGRVKKDFKFTYEDEDQGLLSALLNLLACMFVGAGSALGIQFILIMLKSFKDVSAPENLMLIFTISVVAGVGARRLLPKITGSLEDQVARASRQAIQASHDAQNALEAADTARKEATLLQRATASLRENAPRSEIEWSINAIEKELASNKSLEKEEERTLAIYLGRLYRRKGEMTKAISALDKFIDRKKNRGEKDEHYADALYNKSCYLALLKDKDGALVLLEESITINPKNKQDAKSDDDFSSLRNDEPVKQKFADLVS